MDTETCAVATSAREILPRYGISRVYKDTKSDYDELES